MRKQAANYSCVGILVDYNFLKSLNTDCTFAQLGSAVEELSRQFVKAKLPPIKLIVVAIPIAQPGNVWSALIPEYASTQPSKIPDGPPSIDMAFLEGPPSMSLMGFYGRNSGIHFVAEEEPGSLNSLLLSPGFIAYRWIYFLLVSS
ncbi:hypothetical protein BDF19DRAFT_428037 [Syncephalis fuscata]|nr:hypothetical protein BDF19DRAFT_428037 [Syncephalis fuscata]